MYELTLQGWGGRGALRRDESAWHVCSESQPNPAQSRIPEILAKQFHPKAQKEPQSSVLSFVLETAVRGGGICVSLEEQVGEKE